jgi:HD-like signal output (HDOD) protein
MAAKLGTVEAILARLGDLPTLPSVSMRLLSVGAADKVEIEQVVKIIETDPALSARILGLCRRSERGLGDRITTVKRAVVMLGLEAVRAAALSVSIVETLGAEKDEERNRLDEAKAKSAGVGEGVAFDRAAYWKYSIAVACASELIASENARLRIVPEEAFLSGLLHGVGKLALAHVLPKAYQQVLRLGQIRACDAWTIERELLGIDYHAAGRRLAEHWGLPEHVQRVIWLHAQPDLWAASGEGPGLVKLVALARALCRHLHLGNCGDYGAPEAITPIADSMSIRRGALDSIVGPLHAAVSDRLRVLGLTDTTPPALLLESLTNANRQLTLVNAAMRQRTQAAQALGIVLGAVRGVIAEAATCATEGAAAGTILSSARRAAGLRSGGLVVARPAGCAVWCTGDASPRPIEVSSSFVEELRSGEILPVSRTLLAGAASRAGGFDLDPSRAAVLLINSAACLVFERDPSVVADERTLRPLAEAWGVLLSTARERELSLKRGERLAESGRVMAQLQHALSEKSEDARAGARIAELALAVSERIHVIEGHASLLRSTLRDPAEVAALDAIRGAASAIAALTGGVPGPSTVSLTPQGPTASADAPALVKAA